MIESAAGESIAAPRPWPARAAKSAAAEPRHRRREGRGREDAEAGEEHAAAAEQVGGAAAEQEQAAEDERVGGDRPADRRAADVEVAGEARHGDVHGGDVEDDHQLGDQEQREEPLRRRGVGCGIVRVWWWWCIVVSFSRVDCMPRRSLPRGSAAMWSPRRKSRRLSGYGRADGAQGSLPQGTVTFLFTDIEGSTRLLERSDVTATASCWSGSGSCCGVATEAGGGAEVDATGDSMLAVFPSAGARSRRRLRRSGASAERWPDDAEVRVRMGLHTGEATLAERATSGSPCTAAGASARPPTAGKILISSATQAIVARRPPDGDAVQRGRRGAAGGIRAARAAVSARRGRVGGGVRRAPRARPVAGRAAGPARTCGRAGGGRRGDRGRPKRRR